MRWIRTGIGLIEEKQFILWKEYANIFNFWCFEYMNFYGAWCFTLSKILSNEELLINTFFNIFISIFCCGSQYMKIFYIPFIFYYYQQALITFRVSLLLSPSNYTSGVIVYDEGSFLFSPETEYTSFYTFTSTLQLALKLNQRASHNCYSVKNILKLLALQ